MKVRELIEKLEKLDPNLEILGYSEDEAIQRPGHGIRLFDVVTIEATNAIRSRDSERVPVITFDNENGRQVAVLELTIDF
jgi:hypothetical protein